MCQKAKILKANCVADGVSNLSAHCMLKGSLSAIHFAVGCRTVNKVPLTTMINTQTLKIFKKYSPVSQLLETHTKLKLIL